MLHNSRNEYVLAVADSVSLALESIVQESVYKDRSVGSYADSGIHINSKVFSIVNNFHSTSAKNVGRSNHYRVADLLCNRESVVNRNSHSRLWHGDTKLFHHASEQVSVLSKVDGLGSCSENVHACLFKVSRKIKGSLSAKLCDNAHGLFLFMDRKNIFKSKGLEIKLVRGIIVGGNSLRVAVYHDSLEAQLLESICSVNTAVIELNTLTDSVGA